jgi:hypothetical protein
MLVEYFLTLVQQEPHSLPVPLHYVAIHIHTVVPQAQEECHAQKMFHSRSKGMQQIKGQFTTARSTSWHKHKSSHLLARRAFTSTQAKNKMN